MGRKLRVYLSCGMYELDGNKRAELSAYTFALSTRRGFAVLSTYCLPSGLDRKSYAPICTAMLDASDVVVVLPGKEELPGTVAEIAYARCQCKPVVYVGGKWEEELNELEDKIV